MSILTSRTINFNCSTISNAPLYHPSITQLHHCSELRKKIGNTVPSKIAQLVNTLVTKLITKAEHKTDALIFKINQAILEHPDVKELISTKAPINALTERGIIAIAKACYGGSVSYQTRQPVLEWIVGIAKDFFLSHNPLNVKLGCFLDFVKHHPKNKHLMPSTSIIRNMLTGIIPEKYLTRGRSSTDARDILTHHFAQNPNLI